MPRLDAARRDVTGREGPVGEAPVDATGEQFGRGTKIVNGVASQPVNVEEVAPSIVTG
jgi:hypothetical protein